ncbi:hypothetical protein Trydic_g20198 [Trypoxylus dichotomus]
MKSGYLIGLFLLFCFAIVFAFPSLEASGGNIIKCHFLDCPAHTVICERNTTTLENPKVIRTVAVCKDMGGAILKSDQQDEPNEKSGYKTNIYTFRLNYNKSSKQVTNS